MTGSSLSRPQTLTPYAPGPALAPPRPAPAPPPEEGGFQWDRALAAVRRYRWLSLGIVLIGTGMGLAFTRLLTPSYEVHSTIWINNESARVGNRGPLRTEELLSSTAWVELLTSFAISDRVVRSLSLYLGHRLPGDSTFFNGFGIGPQPQPGLYRLTASDDGKRYTLERVTRLGPVTRGRVVLETGMIGDSVGRTLGFRWVPSATLPPARELDFSVATPRQASIELRKGLSATLPPGSNFMRLTLVGSDPRRTAATLNQWMAEFISAAADLKKRNFVEFAATLESQLHSAEQQLRSAEVALEGFRVQTITMPSEGGVVAGGLEMTRDPVFTSFFRQKVRYDEVRRDREALEAILGEARAGSLSPEALVSAPAALEGNDALRSALTELYAKRSQLRAARQVYTDEFKVVRDLDDAVKGLERGTIPQLVGVALDRLRREENELARRIGNASTELRNIPVRTIEEMRLRRQVRVAEELYTTLQSRYEEARLAGAGATPDISILDYAVPPSLPSRNTAPKIILMAVMASLAVAVGFPMLLDRRDPRFRYPEQATQELGLDVLGFVPKIRKNMNVHRHGLEAAKLIEAFRSLRLGLRYAFGSSSSMSITVTSPGPADGKSLVASNLALSFAESGLRTLLVDGDIRRGSLHTTFGVPSTPGLLDYLAGEATEEQIVRETSYDNLSMVAGGRRRARGPELLASIALPELLGKLRGLFDVVIVDSAPLGAGIDPYALGVATEAMVIVLRTGTTDRRLAHARLQLVDRVPVRILGAVLNDVQPQGAYQYYTYLDAYQLDTRPTRADPRSSVGELTGRT